MRSSGILAVVSNSGPRAAAANPPQFPDGGTGTPRREEKCVIAGWMTRVPLFKNSKVLFNVG